MHPTHRQHHQRIQHIHQGDQGCSALSAPSRYNDGVPCYLFTFSHTVPVHLTAKSILPYYSLMSPVTAGESALPTDDLSQKDYFPGDTSDDEQVPHEWFPSYVTQNGPRI